jgi:hypothetical protein
MNIAWSAPLFVWPPLRGLLRGLLPAPRHTAAVIQTRHSGAVATAAHAPRRAVASPRPLRVVRVMEAGQTRSQVGRMVISGRMADVCAELDRLAACEAA